MDALAITGTVIEARTGRTTSYDAYAYIMSTTEQPEEGNRAKVDPMAANPAQDAFVARAGVYQTNAPAGTKRTLIVDVTGGTPDFGFLDPIASGVTFTEVTAEGRHAEWTFVY